MKLLRKETLAGIREQLAAHPFEDEELDELADPKLGIITGFQELLKDLEELRSLDLGQTPPAQGVQPDQIEP